MDQNKPNHQLTISFLEELNKYLGKAKIQKDTLAEELSISVSSLYKKLRGDIAFTLDEVGYLAPKYNISLDNLCYQRANDINIKAPHWDRPVQSISQYFESVRAMFDSFGSLKNMQVMYAAREAPLFYYFNQPKLGLFKLYTYARTVWKLPEFSNQVKFSMNLFSEDVILKMSELWQMYAAIPSIEIWNPNVFDNTLQQILYLVEEKKFNEDHDAPELLSDLRQVMFNILEMIQKGHKLNAGLNKPASLEVYNNKMMHTNNLIVASSNEISKVFMTHDNPNILWSDNTSMVDYTLDWIKRLQQNSVLLNDNTIQTTLFKDSILRKIELTEQKVKAYSVQKEEFL